MTLATTNSNRLVRVVSSGEDCGVSRLRVNGQKWFQAAAAKDLKEQTRLLGILVPYCKRCETDYLDRGFFLSSRRFGTRHKRTPRRQF